MALMRRNTSMQTGVLPDAGTGGVNISPKAPRREVSMIQVPWPGGEGSWRRRFGIASNSVGLERARCCRSQAS